MRDWLKEARLKKPLTQKQMASELGISEAYYSLIENGERQQNMDISLAIKIGNILGMNLQEIASAEEEGA